MKIIKWILVLIALVLVSGIGFAAYMGLFSTPEVLVENRGPYTFIYDSFTGPYKDTAPVFDRVMKDVEAKGVSVEDGLGIYYDDPRKTPPEQLRSDCGVVIDEGEKAQLSLLQDRYKIKTLEEAKSLVVRLPIKNSLSYMIGPSIAYPALEKYAKKNQLKTTVAYEYYDMSAGIIEYIMPIAP